eukprot:scaffold7523_cov39-Prasinocladus_malaysianus.AAC.1
MRVLHRIHSELKWGHNRQDRGGGALVLRMTIFPAGEYANLCTGPKEGYESGSDLNWLQLDLN